MSVGEIVGLTATALLAGLLIGLWVGVSMRPGCCGRRPCRRDRIDGFARWLAARRSLSRASTSLVAAFRSMAAEPQAAANHALRRDEAQRARAFWCEAMRELDHAEAALVVQGLFFDDDLHDRSQTRSFFGGRRPLPNGHGTDRGCRMTHDHFAWAAVDRVDAAALQVAINGTKSDVEQLLHSLETIDAQARDLVREAVTRLERHRSGIVGRWTRDLLRSIAIVVDRWSEP